MKLLNLETWQVGLKVKLLNFVEDDFYEFCRNSVWILFWENFYNYLLRNIFFEDRKLKIIALIYGRFNSRVFCVESTLLFSETFRILRAESAFRQSWKRQAESLFEANLRHTAESKTTENKLYDKTPNP